MRFFAFLAVFFFHGLPAPVPWLHTGPARVLATGEAALKLSGESGVGLFFLLSAYLIAELLRREQQISGTIDLKLFYIRRTLRIWPLYYLAVGLGFALGLHTAAYHLSVSELLTFLFFVKNWDVVYRGWNWNPTYILWTISAEEQFYLVWPYAQKVLNRRRLMILCVIAFITISSIALWPRGLFALRGVTEQCLLMAYFPVGGLIALLLNGRRREAGLLECAALFIGGLVFWLLGSYCRVQGSSGLANEALGRAAVLVGTVALFFAFFESKPSWWARPLVYCGKISYGLYVFHVFWIQMVKSLLGVLGAVPSGRLSYPATYLTLALGATLLTATASYELFEKRFLRLKDRFAVVASRAA